MSESKGKVPAFPDKVMMTITLDVRTGAVNVSGPLQDLIMCCGMLEVAKRAVLENTASQQTSRLSLVPQ